MMMGYIAIIVETLAKGYRHVKGELLHFLNVSFFYVKCSFAEISLWFQKIYSIGTWDT